MAERRRPRCRRFDGALLDVDRELQRIVRSRRDREQGRCVDLAESLVPPARERLDPDDLRRRVSRPAAGTGCRFAPIGQRPSEVDLEPRRRRTLRIAAGEADPFAVLLTRRCRARERHDRADDRRRRSSSRATADRARKAGSADRRPRRDARAGRRSSAPRRTDLALPAVRSTTTKSAPATRAANAPFAAIGGDCAVDPARRRAQQRVAHQPAERGVECIEAAQADEQHRHAARSRRQVPRASRSRPLAASASCVSGSNPRTHCPAAPARSPPADRQRHRSTGSRRRRLTMPSSRPGIARSRRRKLRLPSSVLVRSPGLHRAACADRASRGAPPRVAIASGSGAAAGADAAASISTTRLPGCQRQPPRSWLTSGCRPRSSRATKRDDEAQHLARTPPRRTELRQIVGRAHCEGARKRFRRVGGRHKGQQCTTIGLGNRRETRGRGHHLVDRVACIDDRDLRAARGEALRRSVDSAARRSHPIPRASPTPRARRDARTTG